MDEPNPLLIDTLIDELAAAWKLYDKAIEMRLKAISLALPQDHILYWEAEIARLRSVILLLFLQLLVPDKDQT